MSSRVLSPVQKPGLFEGNYPAIRKFVYYSTMLGLFSASLMVEVGVHIFLFYGIMLVNFVLMFVLINYARIPAWIPCLFLYLAISGGIGIINGTDTPTLFAKEFVGISASVLYYYYFFRLIRNDYERTFQTYVRIAFWFVLAGVPLWILTCVHYGTLLRMKGLTGEPGQLCSLVLPAYYWCAYQYAVYRKQLLAVFVFTVAIALSGSTLGYMSVAFGIILLLSRRGRYFVAIPVVVCILLFGTYSISSNFRIRVDDLLFAASNSDLKSVDLSTYALLSNAYVTQQVLHENLILGDGLGSHALSHERFLGSIPGVEQFLMAGQADINAPDAASFTLRVLSEFGVLGYAGVLIFVVYFYVGGRSTYAAISNAILTCFFLKLVRGGIYFPPEQFYLVFVYILNHRQAKLAKRASAENVSPVVVSAPLNLLES